MPKRKIKKSTRVVHHKTSVVSNEFIIFLSVVAIVFLGIFILFFSGSTKTKLATPRKMTVALSAENYSKQAGVATITELGDKVVVNLDLENAPKSVSQPAHIHKGTCPGVGQVVYSLTSAVNGVSETTLDVSYDTLIAGLPLALNVHKSTTQSNIYVSCGELTN